MSSTPSRVTPARHHIDALKRRIAYLQERTQPSGHNTRFRKGLRYELAELDALEWAVKQLHAPDEQDVLRKASTKSFLGQTESSTGDIWFPGGSTTPPEEQDVLRKASTKSLLWQTTTPEERADRR